MNNVQRVRDTVTRAPSAHVPLRRPSLVWHFVADALARIAYVCSGGCRGLPQGRRYNRILTPREDATANFPPRVKSEPATELPKTNKRDMAPNPSAQRKLVRYGLIPSKKKAFSPMSVIYSNTRLNFAR